MCPTSFCRLCLCSSTDIKELVNENGQFNDVYKIAAKYFEPMLLTTVICENCWQHIYNFYEFQQAVLKAQADLENFGNNEPLVKLEMMIMDEEEEDLKEDVNISISNSIDLKDSNSFDSGSDGEMTLDKLNESKEYIKKLNDSTSLENSEDEREISKEFTFLCIFCDKKFKDAEELLEHKTTHTGKKTYQCPYCETKFNGKKNISRHVKSLHPQEHAGLNIKKLKSLQEEFNLNSEVLKTEISSEIDAESESAEASQLYATSDEDKTSKPTYKDLYKFKCKLCGSKYKYAFLLRNHMKFTHNRETYSVRCPHCPSTISEPRNLRRHIKAKHPEKYVEPEKNDEPRVDLNLIGRDLNSTEEHTPNYDDYDAFIAKWKPELECPLCKSIFTNFGSVSEHFKQEHPEKRRHVLCCEYKITSRIRLVEHLRFHLDPNSFKCKICGRCTTDRISLSHHMRVHSDEKPFQCKVCQKSFRLKCKLLLHSGTHSTERNEICKICDKGFTTKEILKKHIYNSHKNCKSKHLCEQCGKACYNDSALKEHLLEHAGIKWPCDQCGIQLKSSLNLKRHIKTCHNGSKTVYVCSECGKKWANRHYLKVHKKTVHGGECKPKFKCNMCDKELSSAVNLRLHEATHNAESHYQCPHCPVFLKQKHNIARHIKVVHPQMYHCKRSKVDISLIEQSIVI